jgi:hypothetical protein
MTNFSQKSKVAPSPPLIGHPKTKHKGTWNLPSSKRFKMIWVHTGMKAMDASTPAKPKAASLGLFQVGDQQSQ